jgi:hypothetical protein
MVFCPFCGWCPISSVTEIAKYSANPDEEKQPEILCSPAPVSKNNNPGSKVPGIVPPLATAACAPVFESVPLSPSGGR